MALRVQRDRWRPSRRRSPTRQGSFPDLLDYLDLVGLYWSVAPTRARETPSRARKTRPNPAATVSKIKEWPGIRPGHFVLRRASRRGPRLPPIPISNTAALLGPQPDRRNVRSWPKRTSRSFGGRPILTHKRLASTLYLPRPNHFVFGRQSAPRTWCMWSEINGWSSRITKAFLSNILLNARLECLNSPFNAAIRSLSF
jgi:hypothetical protein